MSLASTVLRTLRSLEAFPASSSTSAVRYSAVHNEDFANANTTRPCGHTGSPSALQRSLTQDCRGVHSSGSSHTSIGRDTALYRSTTHSSMVCAHLTQPPTHNKPGVNIEGGQDPRPMLQDENACLQKPVDTPYRELQASASRARHRLLLVSLLVTHGALGTLAGQPLCSLPRHAECFIDNWGSACRRWSSYVLLNNLSLSRRKMALLPDSQKDWLSRILPVL